MSSSIIDIDDEAPLPPPVKIRIKVHNEGPALWPSQFPARELRKIKGAVGSYYFSALYQGSPSPEGGGMFKSAWFQYWKRIDDHICFPDGRSFRLRDCRRYGTCDLAFSVKTTADRTAIGAWATTPDSDLVLLDLHCERMNGNQLVPSLRRMIQKWELEYMGIEDVAAQTLVVQTARKAGLTVRALKANLDKITRSMPAQVRMEAGQVWFPLGHSSLEILKKELTAFPNGAHDDTVDVLAYAALELQRFGPPDVPPEERARLERERQQREWEAKVARDKAAQANLDDPRWWQDAWGDETN